MPPDLLEQEYIDSHNDSKVHHNFYQSINVNGCFKTAEIYLSQQLANESIEHEKRKIQKFIDRLLQAKEVNKRLGAFNWDLGDLTLDVSDSVWYPCILRSSDVILPKTDWDDMIAF